jgi:hypothetical protein
MADQARHDGDEHTYYAVGLTDSTNDPLPHTHKSIPITPTTLLKKVARARNCNITRKRRSRVKPGDDGKSGYHYPITAVPPRGRRGWQIKPDMTAVQ